MDLRVYEILFQFNQGLDQSLESLSTSLRSCSWGFPRRLRQVRTNLSWSRYYANNHFASKIAQKE